VESLQELADERAILRVLSLYCHTIDTGRADEWLECFTPDGAFIVRDAAGKELIAERGREKLKAYFEQLMTKVPPRTQDHLTVNPLVALDGDQATAVSYFITTALGEQGPLVRSRGRYHDRLRRTASGWKLAERVAVSLRTPAPMA
jgi:ketosteroid isomerase-like protein